MSDHYHAVVWLDHSEAKVFYVETDKVDRLVVKTHAAGHHMQHRANITGSGHRGVDKKYFQRVSEALTHTGAILITSGRVPTIQRTFLFMRQAAKPGLRRASSRTHGAHASYCSVAPMS